MSSSPVKSTPANTIIETSLVLCDCIREWQDETANTGDGKLDWTAISLKMMDRTGKPVSKLDLQTVWRYIAYGKHFSSSGREEEESTYSDDEEPFLQPFSAVKRHKLYLSQDRPEGVSMQERIYLPPSVPDSMDVRTVGSSIKMDIPQHIKHIDGGLQPPQYVPSSEVVPRSIMTRPLRNSRVSQLAVLGNPTLSTALRHANEPVMAHPPTATASSYQTKKPEAVVAQALNRSLPTAHAPGATVQNKLATVAGVWTTSIGSIGSSGSSVSAGKVAVPVQQVPTASKATAQPSKSIPSAPVVLTSAPAAPTSLKRPYMSPEEQQQLAQMQVETSGYIYQPGQTVPYVVGAMSPALLAMPVPMLYSIPPAYAPVAMPGSGSSSGGVNLVGSSAVPYTQTASVVPTPTSGPGENVVQ